MAKEDTTTAAASTPQAEDSLLPRKGSAVDVSQETTTATTDPATDAIAQKRAARQKRKVDPDNLSWMSPTQKTRIADAFSTHKEEVRCDDKVIGEISVLVIREDWLKTLLREFVDNEHLWRKEARMESTELLTAFPTLKARAKTLETAARKAKATAAQTLTKLFKERAKSKSKPSENDDNNDNDNDNQDDAEDDNEMDIRASAASAIPSTVTDPIIHYEIARRLVEHLEQDNKEVMEMLENMKKDGIINYNCLWSVFQTGDLVVSTNDNNLLLGGEVMSTKYQRSCWSNQYNLDITMIKVNTAGSLQTTKVSLSIPAFRGTVKISSLPVRPMDPESLTKLTERGKIFARVATGSHFMAYRGAIMQRSWWSTQMHRADGRVMVDTLTHKRMNPSYSYACSNDVSKHLNSIPEDRLYSTWPTVLGFSFTAKKWGELCVDALSEVVFDDDAFDRLVLDASKKTLIRALVENQHAAVSDIISGKGGGCIFLLHGPPGTGKTLTAEAIAELLHRPLYSVSVGELGTSTTELEKSLRDILEVATTWNAVILIDEADIFLERRTENDIVRNAMVGIFLRLLEYHQGVLFLTTNRVRCFDEAFHSRISVALHYEALTSAARASVWRNFLDKAGIPADSKDLDANELGKFELNGRQIKNTIRLAQALACSEGVQLQAKHVQRTIDVARQFQQDLAQQGSA